MTREKKTTKRSTRATARTPRKRPTAKAAKQTAKRAKKAASGSQPSMAARIAELEDMTTDELRSKYREVFGEETRSRNKTHLWKKIAWRIQALEEGGLSERAKQRAAELADDADVRVRAPKGATETGALPAKERTVVARFTGRVRDPRLPVPGTVLTRKYKGKTVKVTVLDEGFEHGGRVYRSLSGIAKEVTGSHWNGFLFFGLTKAGGSKR